MAATKREFLVIHADELGPFDLTPLPIAGGEAPLVRAILAGTPVVLRGIDRAVPSDVARIVRLAEEAIDAHRAAGRTA